MFRKIKIATKLLKWRNLDFKSGYCPLCGPTFFVKLDNYEMAIRCLRCRSSAATMSFVSVVKRLIPDLSEKHVYELSAQGPLVKFLLRSAGKVTLSEYFDDVPLGKYKGKIQCQDVERLTYDKESFDICTSTEVFEHVPHDLEGFKELYRILKRGGVLMLTVPLSPVSKTVERAKIIDGEIQYLLPPEYHGDRIRGFNSVLCFRNYGQDIVDRLDFVGFHHPRIVQGDDPTGWGFSRGVVVASK